MIKSIISALGFFHRGFLIMAGFALCMLFCACVLMLPVSQNGGAHLSFLDVLFYRGQRNQRDRVGLYRY